MEGIRENRDNGDDIGGFHSAGWVHAVGRELRVGNMLVFGAWEQRAGGEHEQESEVEGRESDRQKRGSEVHGWAVYSGKNVASQHWWALLVGLQDLKIFVLFFPFILAASGGPYLLGFRI